MSNQNEPLVLAGVFPPASRDEWEAKASEALKGKPTDSLASKTYDDITIKPLYARGDFDAATDGNGMPGAAPFVRGGQWRDPMGPGWDMRSRLAHPQPGQANIEALHDLERGMSSVLLRFDNAGQAGRDGDEGGNLTGAQGVMVYTKNDLAAVLDGVLLDLAPISLEAGNGFAAAAAFLMGVWKDKGIADDAALGLFNADPLGTLAREGALAGALDSALEAMAALAKHTAATYPKARAVGVDATIYHDAGASNVQVLAYALATGVAYLRAMEQAGMALDEAAKQIQFKLAVDADQFATIAALRAFRLLWSRVQEACGVEASAALVSTETAARMTSEADPWVNMLRGTTATFGAAVGGADAISVRTYDDAMGVPSTLGRRIARNTQIILGEESHLAKVHDPAGGAFLFESLTQELAGKAWALFQQIEQAGGMAAYLTGGKAQDDVRAIAEARAGDIAKRKLPITGVSEFPNVNEDLPELDLPAIHPADLSAARGIEVGAGVNDWVDAAAKGASLSAITKAAMTGTAVELAVQFETETLSASFEALRKAAKASDPEPSIFLANLGPVSKHTGRATFAKNFFEAGGIVALSTDGFDDAAAAADAFKQSGAKLAVICGSDDQYETMAVPFAEALKAAGATAIYLAGKPGDAEAAYRGAGIDGFIAMGSNVLAVLTDAHAKLGVN